MLNDMMQKEGWTRSYALSVRSEFESEERYQEKSYVDNLIEKAAKEQEEEQEFEPTATTTTTDTVAQEGTTTKEPAVMVTTLTKPQKVTTHQQEAIPLKFLSKQLGKQTIQINKNIMKMLQPFKNI
jgi:predicted fused transcriptional regulator/phosphomethylpyrimidine kinase